MENLLKNWSITRIIHLVFGSIILYYAFEYSNYYLGLLGGGFFIQSVLNNGCSNGSCKRRR